MEKQSDEKMEGKCRLFCKIKTHKKNKKWNEKFISEYISFQTGEAHSFLISQLHSHIKRIFQEKIGSLKNQQKNPGNSRKGKKKNNLEEEETSPFGLRCV